jgi:hypothetical protein
MKRRPHGRRFLVANHHSRSPERPADLIGNIRPADTYILQLALIHGGE